MNYLYQNIYRYDIENNDYVLFTSLNGTMSFNTNTRVFMGKNNIPINEWSTPFTNLRNGVATVTHVNTKTIPANTETLIATVNDFEESWCVLATLCSILSFVTSDYNNITDSDSINILVTFNNSDVENYLRYNITQKLKKQYMNTVNITYTKYLNSNLGSIKIYVTSTFPVILRAPIRNNAEHTYFYVVNM